jgi:acetyl-CoA carboxylase beta subunit
MADIVENVDMYLGCHLSHDSLAKCPECNQQMYYDDVEDVYFCKTHGGCFQIDVSH